MASNSSIRYRCALFFLVASIAAVIAIGIGFIISGGEAFNADSSDPTNQTLFQVGWESNGQGLNILVLNSLQESWSPIFDYYIEEWDNGSPDSLTISTEKHPHSPTCDARTGVVNVCNGDYGQTTWRGRAHIWRDTSTGFIVSVAAVLNDYYLQQASTAQRRYTCCHELGHAFGLPHTDEDHLNEDQFNCLDYTLKPWNNLDPGQVNFDKLYALYGSVNDRTRSLRAPSEVANRTASLVPISTSLTEEHKAVTECLDANSCSECMEELSSDGEHGDTRRMLYKKDQGEACTFKLGGYVLESHMLLVQ